jgi:membrane protein
VGTIVHVLGRALREQSAEQVSLAASGAAFWMVITIFPTAIAAVSLFGLIVRPAQVADDLARLADKSPASLGATLGQQLQRVAGTDRVGLSAGLVVSLVLALWSASTGVYGLDRAIRGAYGLPPRSYVRARGRALVGAAVVVVVIGAVGLASTAATGVVRQVPGIVDWIIGLPLIIAVLAVVAAALYRFAIGDPTPVAQLVPGALAAAVGMVVLAAGFTAYIGVSTHYVAVYGALAGAVIGMIGTYLVVYVLLLGAVLNAQMANTRSIP